MAILINLAIVTSFQARNLFPSSSIHHAIGKGDIQNKIKSSNAFHINIIPIKNIE